MSLLIKKRKSKSTDRQSLRINRSHKRIDLDALSIFIYRDKDTRQIIVYAPSLDLTGYGENEDKAEKMLQFSMSELFHYWLGLPPKKLDSELIKLGWQQDKVKQKQYSSPFVDKNGVLNDFNAVADDVQEAVLSLS